MRAAFAIPGDLDTVTGGYLYERRLLDGLRALGADVEHLRLAASFPRPTVAEATSAAEMMAAVPVDVPLIVDGLVFGSLPTDLLATVRAPIAAMIHHPLAHEEGLDAAERERLFTTERGNLRLARAVLVPSAHTTRVLVDEYSVNPRVITVARPGTDRPPGRRHPDVPPLILSVGILHPRKGHDVLLRALAIVLDRNWTAVIVGSAYDRSHTADLYRLRDELGLHNRVRFTGLVSVADRDALTARASIFALATRYEGYGLVFDEALARGLPIVTCRTGAVPETVPAEAGVLVPPGDPAAFAHAVGVLLDDPQRRERMSAAASAAGATLPGWLDTAAVALRVLEMCAFGDDT